jgi:outer membrane protein OmpA-like peptidoglycan-associated protein
MFRKALIGSIVIAMSSGVANAGDNKLTKHEGVGMGTGAAIGAIVGGPIGAFVGLMVGGAMGDSIGTAKLAEQRAHDLELHARDLEQQLIDTQVALAQASERKGGDSMLDQLAEQLHSDVMFRTASAELDPGVAGKLEEIGKLLAVNSQIQVQLNGFADPRGTPEENLELSHQRADAVREALIRGGASPDQVLLSAHGEDLTTAAKDDVEAYAWERRVTLAIRPVTSGSESAVAQTNDQPSGQTH